MRFIRDFFKAFMAPQFSPSFQRRVLYFSKAWLVVVIALASALATMTVVRAAAIILATKTDALVVDADGDGLASPGDTLEYTVTITNGGTDAAGVAFTDTIDHNTTLVPGSLVYSPVAVTDTYPQIVIGNVGVNSALIPYSVITNDNLGNPVVATISAFDAVSLNGGQVVMVTSGAALGQFTYNPPPGFEGTDTFTYTLTNSVGSMVGTVNLSVSGMVWFINNSTPVCTTLAAGCGRLLTPFSSLAAFKALNDGSGNNPADNDNIFIYESSTAYGGGVTLRSGQKLIGQDSTQSLSTITGLTPPTSSSPFPVMNTGGSATTIQNSGGNAVTLNQGNLIYGLTISGTSGAGILGSNINTLTVGSDVGLTGVSGTDLDLSGTASGAINFGASIANSSGGAISIQNRASGTVTFTGAISDTGGTGVLLNNNNSAEFIFSGGLTLSTGTKPAFTATGGGTLNICDENPCNPAAAGTLVNTLTTTTAAALNISGTSIGPNNLEFRSINVDGNDSSPANGIVLNNTGAAGGLIVRGTGSAGSGGTVQDTSGDGMLLTNTQKISLTAMSFTSNLGSGIRGTNLNGFILNNSSVTNNGDQASPDESGIELVNLTGGANPTSITNSTISNNYEFELQITNNSGTLTDFQMSANTISSNGATGFHGNLVNFLALGTANMKLTVASGTFAGAAPATATGIQCDHSGTSGTMTCNVSGATFTNNNVAVSVSQALGGDLKFTVNGNTATGNRAHGLNLFVAANSTGTSDGSFTNNIVGTSGTVGSGSSLGYGIRVQNEGIDTAHPVNVLIRGNTIQEMSNFGGVMINQGISGQTSSKPSNITISNNIIRDVDNSRAIVVQQNNVTDADSAGWTCADISGNEMNNVAGQAGDGSKIRLRQLAGNGGIFNVRQTSVADMAAANTPPVGAAVTTTTAAQVIASGTFTYSAGACAQPSALLPGDNLVIAQEQVETSPMLLSQATQPGLNSTILPGRDKTRLALHTQAPQGGSSHLLAVRPAPVEAGETINAAIGTLPAGKAVIIKFRVTINDPLIPLNASQVSNQGSVSGSGFGAILTDDPDVSGTADPTVTLLPRPDLTAIKSNDASGMTTLPTGWTWTVHIANAGLAPARIADAQVVLTDNLPASGLAYGTPAISNASGLTGTLDCTIVSNNLSCSAGGAVQLAASGAFDVTFTVTPGAAGTYANPRASGVCTVDPEGSLVEADEANNACSDSVLVNKADATTSLALTAGTNPSAFSDLLTFTATVSSGAGTPTGTVEFFDGSTSLGSVALSGGDAAFTSTAFSVGAHSLTASYSGDSNFNPSTSSPALAHTVDPVSTTTALAADINPSVFGQTVTFRTTVSSPVGAPPAGGTVTFYDGAASLGTATTNASGQATLSSAGLAVGTHNITAAYAASTSFAASSSSILLQEVNRAAATTSLTAVPNPALVGQAVTFTATVSPTPPGAGTPTGMVSFMDGGTLLGTATLSGGVATLTTSSLSQGNHTATATYSGDGNFNTSASPDVIQAINMAPTATGLTVDINPALVGETVTLTATVTAPPPAGGTPGGAVEFREGTLVLGTGTLSGGTTTFTTASFALGSHNITAQYLGTADYAASLSSTVVQQVVRAATTTTLVAGPSPSTYGESVTLTATVTVVPPASGIPAGTVTFKEGAVNLGTAALNASGQASFSTNSLTAGAHTITATYGGDANFDTSSGVGNQTVTQAPTTTSLTAAPNPSVFGQSVTFTATVVSGFGTPTGTVEFFDGPASLSTVSLAAGTATFTSSVLTVGPHSLRVVYAGDTNYLGSTSTVVTQTIVQAATTTTLSILPTPSVVGQVVTFNYTVSPVAPGAGAPTGNVTVTNGTDTCTAPLSAGSCPITFTSPGTSNFAASYAGDASFAGSTSPSVPHTVNKADTSMAISSDAPDPSILGQPVTVSFTVNPVAPGAGTPSGNVTVSDGTDSCFATVAAGSCDITFTSIGTKSLAAGYSGDSSFNASTSPAQAHEVTKAATTTTIISDLPDPSLSGAPVTVIFSVEVVAPGTGNPSGDVTLSDGVDSCVAGAAAGSCILSLATPGLRTLTASFAGDSNFDPSTSGGAAHTVQQAPAFTSATNTHFTVGTPGTFTITTTGYPDAAITFSSIPVLPPSISFLDNADGTASLSATPLPGDNGTYSITLTADNGAAPHATQVLTLRISQSPAITSASSVTFVAGNPGTFSVTTSGDPTPALTSTGTLPSGVAFTDNGDGTATLAGTPALSSTGAYNLTIDAANGILPDDSQGFTLNVDGPPGVALINSLADTGDGQILENEHTSAAITQLLVVFNKNMNANSVQDPANYSLVRAGSTAVIINAVAYDGPSRTATLSLNNGVDLADAQYALTAKGTLKDTLAAPIGLDFVRNFFVDRNAPNHTSVITLPNNNPITDGATLNLRFASLQVRFDEDVNNPAGDSGADDVTNPKNYLLLTPGPNGLFDTLSCKGDVTGDDASIATGPVTYANNGGAGPFVSTVRLNGGTALPNGSYKLFICGTTSIVDLAGNALNNEQDEWLTFNVLAIDALQGNPKTGFAPGRVTIVPQQATAQAYLDLGDLWIEIPALSLKTGITGVPLQKQGWDVTWLARQVGWLEGTAYPTWEGNTVLTAHGYTADGRPGPFAFLKDLKYGDSVIVHLGGMKYVYAVRTSLVIDPDNTYWLTRHEKTDWITLITCQQYDAKAGSYLYRRIVRAVLVSVTAE